jgi:PAS domain-containing protein
MRVICSYCRQVIREDPHARVIDVSHGMCEPCARHFERLWAGIPLGEYLDDLPSPVIVVDGNGRVLAMNQKLADLLGADRAAAVGLMGGEAFACVRSRLPEGCGRTVHCRECTIRRTVEEVARTGKPKERVRAYLNRADGRVDLRVSARPAKAGTVQVTIEEMGAPRPLPVDA